MCGEVLRELACPVLQGLGGMGDHQANVDAMVSVQHATNTGHDAGMWGPVNREDSLLARRTRDRA